MPYILAGTVALALTAPYAALAVAFALIRDERQHQSLERASWATERATLLQRIQAPSVAVAEHSNQIPTTAPPDPVITDEDHWDAAGVAISKEMLAEHAYAHELA